MDDYEDIEDTLKEYSQTLREANLQLAADLEAVVKQGEAMVAELDDDDANLLVDKIRQANDLIVFLRREDLSPAVIAAQVPFIAPIFREEG